MSVQVRHIQYIIAAADHGSFRRAAATLGVQESAISRRIRELEERLGTAFFIRTPNGVTLTNAGKQFVQRGRKALNEIGLARAEAAAIGRGEDGHVRIGIFSSLASGFLSDLIDTFGAQHPAVKLTFIDGNPADHIAAIRKHQLDVAFITGCADWPGCDGRQLWTERIFVVLPRAIACAAMERSSSRHLPASRSSSVKARPARRSMTISSSGSPTSGVTQKSIIRRSAETT